MQMSLVIRMRFIFGDDGNDAPCLSRFFDFRAFSHALYSIQKQIVKKKKTRLAERRKQWAAYTRLRAVSCFSFGLQ